MKPSAFITITAHQAKVISSMLRGYAELLGKIEHDKNNPARHLLLCDEISDAGELSGYLKQMAKA